MNWKHELMAFDFGIFYGPGSTNVVADGFARLLDVDELLFGNALDLDRRVRLTETHQLNH